MIIENILHHRKIIRVAREYPTILFIIAISNELIDLYFKATVN